MREHVDKLVDALETVSDLPPDVEGALNDLLSSADDDPPTTPWWKAPFFKDGEFSKTATFATLGNAVTVAWFAASAFAGSELGGLVLQKLDVALAMGVAGVLNGTYLVNNGLKARK